MSFFFFLDFNIQEDITCCREALQQQDIQKVSRTSLRMLGRARRVAMVTKKEMNATADPMYKGNLQAACGQLESGVFKELPVCNCKRAKKIPACLSDKQLSNFVWSGQLHACLSSLPFYDLVGRNLA